MGDREHLRTFNACEARPDSRRRRRADLPAAYHVALRAREAAAERRRLRSAICRTPGTPGMEAASGHPPRERQRGLPAGRALGRRVLRLLPIVCPGRCNRRPALREPSQRRARARRAARTRRVLRACSAGCAPTCTGSAPRCPCRSCCGAQPASRCPPLPSSATSRPSTWKRRPARPPPRCRRLPP